MTRSEVMAETIQTILLLLAVLVAVALVARRLNTAPSILLVVAGIALALIPGLPRIELAPELVLLGILPPLIYSAGVAMSWREFRFNLRPIALLAFGCVVFTACAVAVAVHWLLGMPLAVGFVLGAIVSPPDAVAPLALVRRIGLPRRLVRGARRRRACQRCHRADPLPLCRCRGGDRGVLVPRGRRRIRRSSLSAKSPTASASAGQLAAAPLGAGSARRNHAVAAHALRRVSDAAAARRLGRAGDGGGGPLRELERSAAHSRGDAAARHLLLGPRWSICSKALSSSSPACRRERCSTGCMASLLHQLVARGCSSPSRCIVGAVCLGFSGGLSAALAQPSLRRRDPRRPGGGFSCSLSSACAASSRWRRRWRSR